MNRENVLFTAVGLLLGYVVAFHLVVYLNQSQPALSAAGAGGAASAAGETLPTNEVKERQRLQTAAEQTAAAAAEKPGDFDAQVAAAVAHIQTGDWARAVAFLKRANELRPDDYRTIRRLGEVNTEAGNYEEAERWFKAALAKQPDDNDARSELALTYYLRTPRQPEKAIAELNRGLQADPTHLATLHNLTLMYVETGRLAEAEATLARLSQASPNYEQLPQLNKALDDARQKKSGAS
jgi:protein O-GlcNAc transferase